MHISRKPNFRYRFGRTIYENGKPENLSLCTLRFDELSIDNKRLKKAIKALPIAISEVEMSELAANIEAIKGEDAASYFSQKLPELQGTISHLANAIRRGEVRPGKSVEKLMATLDQITA